MAIGALLAQSQPASASDPVVVGPDTVQQLTIKPHAKCLAAESAAAPAPKIVSIFPSDGQVVRPGLLIFRITFDRPMTCGGFLAALAKFASPCPQHEQTFVETFDHRTVRTLCVTQPGQAYGLVVGGDCSQPFESLDGQQFQPRAVRFKTSDGAPVSSVPEALAEEAAGPSSSATASLDSSITRGLDGTWQGEVADQLGRRPLILHVSTDAKGALGATLDSPGRNAFGLPVFGFRLRGNMVEFELPAVDDTYAGTLSADGSTISGRWAQERKPTDFTHVPGPKSCVVHQPVN
jgi:hypothetical protein